MGGNSKAQERFLGEGYSNGKHPATAPCAPRWKLKQIHTRLGLTHAEMFERLGDIGTFLRVGHLGEFEIGDWVLTLQIVLAYAWAAGIPMELIVANDINLAKHLPSMPNYEWIMKRVHRYKR